MEIDKIQTPQYANYKTNENQKTDKNSQNDEIHQEMQQVANNFYASVNQVSTDEDALIDVSGINISDEETYDTVVEYMGGDVENSEENAAAAPVSPSSENQSSPAFSDETEVQNEVYSIINDLKAQLRAKGASDSELTALDNLIINFNAEEFLSENPDATLDDLQKEITREAEKLTGKTL